MLVNRIYCAKFPLPSFPSFFPFRLIGSLPSSARISFRSSQRRLIFEFYIIRAHYPYSPLFFFFFFCRNSNMRDTQADSLKVEAKYYTIRKQASFYTFYCTLSCYLSFSRLLSIHYSFLYTTKSP